MELGSVFEMLRELAAADWMPFSLSHQECGRRECGVGCTGFGLAAAVRDCIEAVKKGNGQRSEAGGILSQFCAQLKKNGGFFRVLLFLQLLVTSITCPSFEMH